MEIGIIIIGILTSSISIGCVIWSIIINRRTKKDVKRLNINIGTKTRAEWLNEIRETKFRAYLKDKVE